MITRAFDELSAREVLALAMDVERNNAERLLRLAETYDTDVPQLHRFFLHLHKEEIGHLGLLEDLWRKKFGSVPPPDVSEFDVPDVVEAVEVANFQIRCRPAVPVQKRRLPGSRGPCDSDKTLWLVYTCFFDSRRFWLYGNNRILPG